MKKFLFAVLASILLCSNVQAVEIARTRAGVRYGLINAGKARPLAIIFTTDIEESLADVHTPLGTQLRQEGFSILSLDVPCHGRDVRSGEVAGLDCWAARIKQGETDVFDRFAGQVDQVVGLLVNQGAVDPAFIVAIGVSRGGYLAIRQLALSRFVKAAVGLVPVTDLKKLMEFRNTPVDQGKLGFAHYYNALAKKAIFVQIGNDDDRVSTQAAIDLINGIVATRRNQDINATLMLMPFRGHRTPKDKLALDWILQQRSFANSGLTKAP